MWPYAVLFRGNLFGALLSCLVVLVAPVSAGEARAATPGLILAPDRGNCASQVILRGVGLPPGQEVALALRQTTPHSGSGVVIASSRVDPDGTLTLPLAMGRILPGCAAGQAPDPGTEFTISVSLDSGKSGDGNALASAIFRIGEPSALPGLPSTGHGALTNPGVPSPTLGFIGLVLLFAVGFGRYLAVARYRRAGVAPESPPACSLKL